MSLESPPSAALVHDWKIPEREYQRQLSRRGRRHAFERLRPTATALLVIDMIPFFSEQNPYCRGVVAPINALAGALRGAGGTVAWVLPSREDPFPALSLALNGEAGAEAYRTSAREGALAGKLCPELAAEPADIFVEKTAASALFPSACALDGLLRRRGIDTAIIVGTVTNVCCESTARDGRALGYRVILAADANAARTDAEHNATLHTIYRSFGDVRPTDEILELIAAG